MRERDYRLWIVLGIGALLFFALASRVFFGWHFGGPWGMMNPEMMDPEMMEHWRGGSMGGPWKFGPFGLFFGLIGLMIRLGFLALLVLGGVWLVSRLSGAQGMPAPWARTACAHCGQSVQRNWRHCPHCGEPLPQADDANDEGGGSGGTSPIETRYV